MRSASVWIADRMIVTTVYSRCNEGSVLFVYRLLYCAVSGVFENLNRVGHYP